MTNYPASRMVDAIVAHFPKREYVNGQALTRLIMVIDAAETEKGTRSGSDAGSDLAEGWRRDGPLRSRDLEPELEAGARAKPASLGSAGVDTDGVENGGADNTGIRATEGAETATTSDIVVRSKNKAQVDTILEQLLLLLDSNLGTVYRRASRKLYGNARPWQHNKRDEMVTPGMVYVVYQDENGQAAFFLSFMLTDEPELEPVSEPVLESALTPSLEPELEDKLARRPRNACRLTDCGSGAPDAQRISASELPRDPQLQSDAQHAFETAPGCTGGAGPSPAHCGPELSPAKVVYLYEIQLRACLQGHGLGTRYVGQKLKHVARDLHSADPTVQGIELTVFSDNRPALRLYRGVGLRLAAWSPRDEIMHTRRNTRSTAHNNGKLVRKPAYYVLFWAI